MKLAEKLGLERRKKMKKILFVIFALILPFLNQAAERISGRVFDRNSGKGISGMLVSDGTNIVRTAADGTYDLELGGKRAYVMLHDTGTFRADKRFVKLEKGRDVYDFPGKKVADKKEVSFLHYGDPETENMARWSDDLVELGKNLKVDFILNGGDICNLHGMNAHAKRFKADEVPFDLFYVAGNHDINKSEPGAYERIIGPYWYSFERGGVIFIAAPMHYGDIGNMRGSYSTGQYVRPYTLEDFGTWLEKLLSILPKAQPKVLMVHGVPSSNTTSISFPTGAGGNIRPAEYNLTAVMQAHTHHNLVMHCQGGYSSYWTSHVNMGGEDWLPAAARLMKYDGKKWSSSLIWSGQDRILSLLTFENDGNTALSAIAYNSADPVVKVTARTEDKSVELTTLSDMAYQAELPGKISGKITVTAQTFSGKSFSREFSVVPVAEKSSAAITDKWENFLGNAEHNGYYPQAKPVVFRKIRFISPVKGEIMMASPVVSGGRVFTAAIDNHNSFNGGIYAFDAVTGKKLWGRRTKNSIHNSLAAGDGKIFAIDLRGKVYALHADSGKVAWTEYTYCSDYRVMTAGVVYSNGKVFAGSRDTLRAIDAKTGKVIWRNPAKSFDTGAVNTITVGGGVVCTATDGDGIYAFDENSGKLLWKHERGQFGGQSASAVYADGKFYVKGTKTLFILEAAGGRIIAQKDMGERLYPSVMPILVTGKMVIVPAAAGNIYCLDKNTLEIIRTIPLSNNAMMKTGPYQTWNRQRGNLSSGAVIRGNIMYLTNADGHLYMIDTDTGKTVHKIELGIPGFCAPAFAGNKMYVTDFAGRLICLE